MSMLYLRYLSMWELVAVLRAGRFMMANLAARETSVSPPPIQILTFDRAPQKVGQSREMALITLTWLVSHPALTPRQARIEALWTQAEQGVTDDAKTRVQGGS